MLGRTPQPLQFMRFTQVDISRVGVICFGRTYQSRQKENLPSLGVSCHMSHFCCNSAMENPMEESRINGGDSFWGACSSASTLSHA